MLQASKRQTPAPVRRFARPGREDGRLSRPLHTPPHVAAATDVAPCACGGGCPRCRAAAIQPKLSIGIPGDAFEREADAVADKVAAGGAVAGIRTVGTEPVLERQTGDEDEAEELLQTKPVGLTASADMSTLDQQIGAIRGGGQPLSPPLRGMFEPRFGHDFSAVRVHNGATAAQLTRAVGARAFTIGRDIVFGNGEYAPESDQGRHLLAHELTHVVQQRHNDQSLMQRELVFAGGYARRFNSDRAEVRCVQRPNCTWFPATIDFRATAENSGGGTGQPSFTGLLDHIAARAAGSIEELGLIGHANRENFGLSGRITAEDVFFTEAGLINTETLAREQARIAGLRDRFAPGATITLYGCHAGVGGELLEAISKAFQVCVRGFSDEVITCLQWRTPSLEIFSRGRVYIDTEGLWAAGLMQCEEFHTNVRDLNPDQESCAGVPAPAQAPAAGATAAPGAGERRFGIDLRAGAGLTEEGWQAALSVGGRYALRSDQFIVINPTIGAQLLYLPSSGDRTTHMAAAIADIGVRFQQPLRGVYADLRAGAYAGFEVPGSEAPPGAETSFAGGFTGAFGLGYRWEHFELGAEARGLVGAGSDRLLILGVGTLKL